MSNILLFRALLNDVMIPVATQKLASVKIAAANADEVAAVLSIGSDVADRIEAAVAAKGTPLTQHINKVASVLHAPVAPKFEVKSENLDKAFAAAFPG